MTAFGAVVEAWAGRQRALKGIDVHSIEKERYLAFSRDIAFKIGGGKDPTVHMGDIVSE